MKFLIASLALVSVLATSAANAASKYDVIVNGQVVGADPDASIRAQLLRDGRPDGF